MLHEAEFIFLRHGETDWNLRDVVQGQQDVPLNATGRAQARAARELLARCEVATICSSPLARALETARIVQAARDCPLEIIDGLKEFGLGKKEGAPNGAWLRDWQRGAVVPEGAEPYGRFIERALAAVNEALTRPGPVLIVSHGGVHWAVRQHARLDEDLEMVNGVPLRHLPPRPDAPWWDSAPVAD